MTKWGPLRILFSFFLRVFFLAQLRRLTGICSIHYYVVVAVVGKISKRQQAPGVNFLYTSILLYL